jgi:hypothetical protein
VVVPEDIVKQDPIENSYLTLRFSQGDQPMYCNYDGHLLVQKTKDYNGEWAQCQNNYECESNVCSSGECIEVQSLLNQEKGFKTLAIKALCLIVNLFSDDEYNQCLSDYLGLPPPIVID